MPLALGAKYIRARWLFAGRFARYINPRGYFKWAYSAMPDPWQCATNLYEQTKYDRTLAALPPTTDDRKVLEIGCGEAVFTERIASLGSSVLAIDISKVAIERARARCARLSHVCFEVRDVTKDGIVGEFDLIFAAEVLDYLGRGKRYHAVCRNIALAVKTGGHLVTVNPFPASRRILSPFVDDPNLQMLKEEIHGEGADRGRPYAINVFTRT